MTEKPPIERSDQLHQLAERFVESFNDESFASIPYDSEVVVRSPLAGTGSLVPLVGPDEVRSCWWLPLVELIDSVSLLDTYVNSDLSAVNAESHYHLGSPICTLRVVDRLQVDANLLITAQESFFDPRDLVDPTWRDPKPKKVANSNETQRR